MLAKRTNVVLLAIAGLLVIGTVAYFLFFAGSDYVKGRPTLKYFRLESWEFCKEMNPIVNEVKKAYRGKFNFVFYEMDTADGKAEARKEGVMGTPTFLLLNGTGERVYMLQGVYPRVVLEQHLDAVLAQEWSRPPYHPPGSAWKCQNWVRCS